MSRVLPTALVALLLSSSALAGYEASSFKRESKLGKNYWNAASALDSNLETCWQVDPEKENVGQYLWLDTPVGEIDKLGVVIGWQKDDKSFAKYARLKKVRVEVFDMANGGEGVVKVNQEISFEDKQGWQVIDIQDAKVGGEVLGGRVKITVLEVYPGKDYPNLAVSEVRVHLKEFPAESFGFSTPPDTEAEGHTGDMLIDNDPKTFWAATGDTASMVLQAPGYGLASLGIQAGPKSHARPKTVEIGNQMQSVRHVLADNTEMQWVLLPCMVGYSGGAWGDVTFKVIDTYPAETAGNGVGIAEMKMNAGTIEDF